MFPICFYRVKPHPWQLIGSFVLFCFSIEGVLPEFVFFGHCQWWVAKNKADFCDDACHKNIMTKMGKELELINYIYYEVQLQPMKFYEA